MPIPDLTPDKLIKAAVDLGLLISGPAADSYAKVLPPWAEAYKAPDAIPDFFPTPKYPRSPGYRPEGEANKYNAWHYWTSIKGASEGKLKGKTVALKDNIMLAAAPMMNGASTLQGYICARDAQLPSIYPGIRASGNLWIIRIAAKMTTRKGRAINPMFFSDVLNCLNLFFHLGSGNLKSFDMRTIN